MQVATCIVIILFNSQLEKYGGDLAIGAYSVVSSLLMLLIMIVVGLNLGTQPIIGYHFGAKSFKRMFLALKYQAVIATLITSIGFILCTFFPTFIVSFFSHDIAVKKKV
jgi:Na+-driven multidrug efflux pump